MTYAAVMLCALLIGLVMVALDRQHRSHPRRPERPPSGVPLEHAALWRDYVGALRVRGVEFGLPVRDFSASLAAFEAALDQAVGKRPSRYEVRLTPDGVALVPVCE